MESLEVGQSFHHQAVIVRFAFAKYPGEMLRKRLTGAFCLGTACEGAVCAQRAIDLRCVHLALSWSYFEGKARQSYPFLDRMTQL